MPAGEQENNLMRRNFQTTSRRSRAAVAPGSPQEPTPPVPAPAPTSPRHNVEFLVYVTDGVLRIHPPTPLTDEMIRDTVETIRREGVSGESAGQITDHYFPNAVQKVRVVRL